VPGAPLLDFGSRLAADESPIDLKSLAFAADWRTDSIFRALHDLTDFMVQKPGSLHAAIEGPLYLPRRDAFLARHDKLDGLQPQVKGEVAILKDAANSHRKGFTAGVALPQARTAALA